MLTHSYINATILTTIFMQKRVLLLGCGGSPAINFAKALQYSKDDIYIVGVDVDKYYIELAPVNKKYLIPHQEGKEKQYVNKLIEIIKREKIDFVHAQPDQEVKIISDYRDLLPAKVLLPSKQAVNICQDKFAAIEAFKTNGVPVPETIDLFKKNHLKKVFQGGNKSFWVRARRSTGGGKASLPVKEYSQAKAWIDFWVEQGLKWSDFIISEYLPGREVSWLSLWKNGELICSQGKQRLAWAKPNTSPSGVGGTSGVQKTVHDTQINIIATKAVQAVDEKPNGIYTVDLKENSRGIPCVTEINIGRFFTTSLFFAVAGVNIPLAYINAGLDLLTAKFKKYNCVPEDIYWIRTIDGGPVMVKKDKWSYKKL